jgi:uncharacterized cupredoxin-like copper-binding protein
VRSSPAEAILARHDVASGATSATSLDAGEMISPVHATMTPEGKATMWGRVLPQRLRIGAAALVVALAACTSASAPSWSFPPPGAQVAGVPGSAAPSASASAAPSAAPSASAASPSPDASPSAAPSPSPALSASPTPRPPGPPDPGEPGFVAGTKANPRIIKIAVTDLLLFEPNVVSVQQGETITFRINNTGQATHEFKVGPMADVFDDNPSTPEVANITPASTKTLTYTFTGTGPYAFACHAPGHYENGMYGFVNVIPTTPWIGTVGHPRMVVIRMDDHLEFVPSEVSVTPGETILFVLPNVGTSVTHEFQVGPADRVALDQADGQIVVEADKIEPLHVEYLTYTFGGVGPYAFACHEPGHYEAGMKGVIDLTP